MPDRMSKEIRSGLMGKIRGKDTKPELAMLQLMRASGLRPKRHLRGVPGSPDFAFPRLQVAVFVDGNFWHGWRYPQWRHKLKPFWQAKIERNRQRDQSNFRKFRYRGWIVVRVWDHQIMKRPDAAITKVNTALERARVRYANRKAN